MKRMVRLIQVLFPLALLTAGIGYALYIHEGYARGQREYADLQDEYTHPVSSEYGGEAQAQDEETEALNQNDIRETEEEDTMQEKRMWKPLIARLPEDAPERLVVSWGELLAKNEDVKAWISVPAVDISYPVLQADDNDYYLHRDISKE